MNKQFDPKEVTSSIKQDQDGFYLETKAGITAEQVDAAKKAGFDVQAEGTKIYAVQAFAYDCPTSIAGFIERDNEDVTYARLIKDDVLDNHARNRASMLAKVSMKIPKENEAILSMMRDFMGIDIDSLSFEVKCDKEALAKMLTAKK